QTLEQELLGLVQAVSHDLRAPLRAADGFSRILLVRYAESLDPEARDFLQRIREAAVQSARQIDALAQLAGIGAGELRVQRVDLAAIARTLIAELRARDGDRSVAVNIAERLEVDG